MKDVRVEVAFSAEPGEVDLVTLTMPAGATVAEALRRSGLVERHAVLATQPLRVGVWGRVCEPGRVLRDGDRVEVYRPLNVDPKEARRLRYQGQPPKRRKAGAAGGPGGTSGPSGTPTR